MKTQHLGINDAFRSLVVVALAFAMVLPSRAQAGPVVYESDDFSVEVGLRMQPRLQFFRVPPPGGSLSDRDWQRQFMIRRARIKLGGNLVGARYYAEWRLDGTGLTSGVVLTSPIAGVENAYIQLPLGGRQEFQIRAGLYDQPFSRDRLTSDSKQLAVDRGAVSNVPAVLGLADNAIGFDLRGKVKGGRYEYAVGVFDNRTIPGVLQTAPMVVGRVDFNFGATHSIFRDAHFGNESWYSLGVNGSYQKAPEDTMGTDDGLRAAFGVDGMLDIPAGPGRLIAVGELNGVRAEEPASSVALDTTVWMLGLGYSFLNQQLQPIVRFDQIRLDDDQGGGETNITHLGLNYYRSGHNLKIQGDVAFESGSGESLDGLRVQMQIDY